MTEPLNTSAISLETVLLMLRCPRTGQQLRHEGQALISADGTCHYRIDDNAIPRFAEEFCSDEGRIQQAHYDRVAADYIENLGYPHTQEYMAYLDTALDAVVRQAPIGRAAEICCGAGEAFSLYRHDLTEGIGVDISTSMLGIAKQKLAGSPCVFVQGDATRMPLTDESFSTVFMLGGIHHVNDREALFSEISRILKPGGRFIWREPVSDFWLWRLLRAIIYRISPHLDHATERPLLFEETAPVLTDSGLELETWKTVGFLGFCLFMNSDVLYFNRLFRFIPGIRFVTRVFTQIDDLTCRVPGLKRSGLIVVGCARKPRKGI